MRTLTADADPTLLPSDVDAVVLFGSRARGDSDTESDTDIAVFAFASQFEDLARIKDACTVAYHFRRMNIAVYSIDTAERLAAHGSLFLWHVRLEAALLFQRSRWLEQLLHEQLRLYGATHARRDLDTFHAVSREIETALSQGQTTALFEAATLFAILRGVGMIVGMRSGRPCFKRLEPIHQLRARMNGDFGLTDAEVSMLAEAKLVYSRRRSAGWHMTLPSLRETAAKVTALMERSFELVA